jgi:hypothetical protein
MTRKMVFLFAALFILSACAPNPVDVAEGERIVMQARQDALAAEQIREQRAVEHALKVKNDQAAAYQFQQMTRGFLRVATVFGSLSLAFALMSTGASVSIAVVGAGKAFSIAAEFKARQLCLDPKTGTYPQFVFHIHGEKYALADPNTHSSRLLDANHEPDRQAIVNAGYIAAVGVQSHNARFSMHNSKVEDVPPPQIPLVIEGTSQ